MCFLRLCVKCCVIYVWKGLWIVLGNFGVKLNLLGCDIWLLGCSLDIFVKRDFWRG